jgi:hypothetical protein
VTLGAGRQYLDDQERVLDSLPTRPIARAGRGDVGLEIGVRQVTPNNPRLGLCVARGRRRDRDASIRVTKRTVSMRCASAGGAIAIGNPPISS